MRLSALTFAAVLAGLTGLAGYSLATAQTGAAQAPPSVAAADGASGQAPFGGDVGSRADRLGADIRAGLRQGWLTQPQAERLAGRLKQIRTAIKSAAARHGGELSAGEDSRLETEVAALHREMGDIAAAARERRRRG